jgi:3-oxoacyl-(acyl-carrier-protein) synthase
MDVERIAMESSLVNAHGTGTWANDPVETLALKLTLGDRAYQVPVSSTKWMTGHLMAATGAVETVFCIQAGGASLPPPSTWRTPIAAAT